MPLRAFDVVTAPLMAEARTAVGGAFEDAATAHFEDAYRATFGAAQNGART